MSNDSKKTCVRKRRWWRWPLRVAIVLVFVVAGAAVYLNQAGLPGFAKRSLQARLAQRGVTLDFDWLRMDWDGAWRAAELRLGQADAVDQANPAHAAFVIPAGPLQPRKGKLFMLLLSAVRSNRRPSESRQDQADRCCTHRRP